jgi:hypothetical protein
VNLGVRRLGGRVQQGELLEQSPLLLGAVLRRYLSQGLEKFGQRRPKHFASLERPERPRSTHFLLVQDKSFPVNRRRGCEGETSLGQAHDISTERRNKHLVARGLVATEGEPSIDSRYRLR